MDNYCNANSEQVPEGMEYIDGNKIENEFTVKPDAVNKLFEDKIIFAYHPTAADGLKGKEKTCTRQSSECSIIKKCNMLQTSNILKIDKEHTLLEGEIISVAQTASAKVENHCIESLDTDRIIIPPAPKRARYLPAEEPSETICKSYVSVNQKQKSNKKTTLKICFPKPNKCKDRLAARGAEENLQGELLPVSLDFSTNVKLCPEEPKKVKKINAKKAVINFKRTDHVTVTKTASGNDVLGKSANSNDKNVLDSSEQTILEANSNSYISHKKLSLVCPEEKKVCATLFNNSSSIISLTHRELMSTLKDCGAIYDGKLCKVSSSQLTVKLVMTAVNVRNFSYDEICLWIIRSRKTKYTSFNEKFTKQFDAYKDLYRLVCSNLETSNGKELLRIISYVKYSTPMKMSSWHIIFPEIPYLLENVALSAGVHEQSLSLNKVCLISHVTAVAVNTVTSFSPSAASVGHLDSTEDRDEANVYMEANLSCDNFMQDKSNAYKLSVEENISVDKPVEKSVSSQCNLFPANFINQLFHSITNIENLIDLNNQKRTGGLEEIMTRLLKIEEHLTLQAKLNHRDGQHSILSQSNVEESKFKKTFLQLNQALLYVKKKDYASLAIQTPTASNKNVVILLQSNKQKTKRISFLQSEVHLLETTVDNCLRQLQWQKRVSNIIKRKLLSLEKCYFCQRSQIVELTEKLSGFNKHLLEDNCQIEASTSVSSSNNQSLNNSVCASKNSLGLNIEKCDSNAPTFKEMIAHSGLNCEILKCSLDNALCSNRYASMDSSGAEINNVRRQQIDCVHKPNSTKCQKEFICVRSEPNLKIDKTSQCNLINDNLNVCLPDMTSNEDFTMKELVNVKNVIVNAAHGTLRMFHRNDNREHCIMFKHLLDALIFYELLLDNKSRLGLSFQTSFKKSNTKQAFTVSESERNILDLPVNASLQSTSQHGVEWNKYSVEELNTIVNGHVSFLFAKEEGLECLDKNARQKLSVMFNDSEKIVIELQHRIKMQQQSYEFELKEQKTKLCEEYDARIKNLKQEIETRESLCKEHYSNELKLSNEAVEKYASEIINYVDNIQALETYQQSVIDRDNLLCKQLDLIYDAIYPSVIQYQPTVLPSDFKIASQDILAKLTEFYNIVSKIENLNGELKEAQEKLQTAEVMIIAIDSLNNIVKSHSSRLYSCQQLQEKMKGKIYELDMKHQELLENIENKKFEISQIKQELLLSNSKIAASGQQISMLISSMQLQEKELKCEKEQLATKLSACEETCIEKDWELEMVKGELIKKKEELLIINGKLVSANAEINKLIVLWDLLEIQENKGVYLNISKAPIASHIGVSEYEIAVLEHITGKAPSLLEDGTCSITDEK